MLPQKYGSTPETRAARSSGADTEETFDPNADKHKVRLLICCLLYAQGRVQMQRSSCRFPAPSAVSCLHLQSHASTLQAPGSHLNACLMPPALPSCPQGQFALRKLYHESSRPLIVLYTGAGAGHTAGGWEWVRWLWWASARSCSDGLGTVLLRNACPFPCCPWTWSFCSLCLILPPAPSTKPPFVQRPPAGRAAR